MFSVALVLAEESDSNGDAISRELWTAIETLFADQAIVDRGEEDGQKHDHPSSLRETTKTDARQETRLRLLEKDSSDLKAKLIAMDTLEA